jgi:hypothetical protein
MRDSLVVKRAGTYATNYRAQQGLSRLYFERPCLLHTEDSHVSLALQKALGIVPEVNPSDATLANAPQVVLPTVSNF